MLLLYYLIWGIRWWVDGQMRDTNKLDSIVTIYFGKKIKNKRDWDGVKERKSEKKKSKNNTGKDTAVVMSWSRGLVSI